MTKATMPTMGKEQKNAQTPTTSKTFIVAFEDADYPNPQPEIYLCSAKKAERIRRLLETVSKGVAPPEFSLFPEESGGPIKALSNDVFVTRAKTVTLTALRSRFKEELERPRKEERRTRAISRRRQREMLAVNVLTDAARCS